MIVLISLAVLLCRRHGDSWPRTIGKVAVLVGAAFVTVAIVAGIVIWVW